MLTKGDTKKRDVQEAMRRLQAVLKAILLRRVKTSLIDGQPIITLPPKVEEIQHVVFSDDEQAFYSALETKTQIQFNKYLKANTVGKNYSNILVLLLRLRQCCCHPHLITDFEQAAPAGADLSAEAMIQLAKSLAPDVIARLLAAEDSFECPVCYDGVANPCIVIPCGHDTCAECLSKISEQAMQQNVADGNEGGATSKCPTCRGKIELGKIIDYATFKKVHKPDPDAEDEEIASGDSDDSDSETDSDSEASDADADADGDLRNFIVPDGVEEFDEDEDPIEDNDDDFVDGAKKSKSKSKNKEEKRRQKARKGKKKGKKEHVSIAMLKKEASRSAEGRRRYMKYLRKNWQPSAKVDKCVELLDQFQQEGQKTIIFSQFVSLLDLLQVPIEKKGWACERYDGSMSSDARNNAIVKFTDKPDCKIMLISLKAGNAGLNLVAASRVIILDPFWNPFVEMQAVDRAYRIGQQNSVQVHRILIKGTVEDRIIELQERKRKLVNAALDEGANKSLGRLDVRQLAFLFGFGDGH
jgi:SNF2 family DNA or RNA helicase